MASGRLDFGSNRFGLVEDLEFIVNLISTWKYMFWSRFKNWGVDGS
jgi:hypothetical protein